MSKHNTFKLKSNGNQVSKKLSNSQKLSNTLPNLDQEKNYKEKFFN